MSRFYGLLATYAETCPKGLWLALWLFSWTVAVGLFRLWQWTTG